MGSALSYHSRSRNITIIQNKISQEQRCLPVVVAVCNTETQINTGKYTHLSDALLLKIFSYFTIEDLMRISRVCQQWRRVGLDPSLWRSVDLSSCAHARIRDRTVICLVSRVTSSAITYIDLSGSGCSRLTNVSLFHIARQCHKLRKLCVCNRNRITSTGIEMVARHCPYLEVLRMSKCPLILSRGLGFVLRRSKLLRELDVSGCLWVTDAVLAEIGQLCVCLVYLSIEGCKKVTDNGIVNLANSCTTIKHINLRNTKRISNAGMEQFLTKLPDLEGLEIGLVRKGRGTAAVLNLVATHCKNLTFFDYQECLPTPVDDVLCQIAEQCQRLRFMGVRYQYQTLSNNLVLTLTKLCPSLVRIDASLRFYI
ncbi:F-box/LRR-repeat protein 20-like [Stylophora pistillata]|uniref:F-box/LRR-repeat protein 2 n=1 Tax=Stylophora pistillata TaxID=50429 RepID=A0A2B4SC90_STYPI|nr:F-box/LRR-repeat protein 20-like [Stylophora pistillata]PFX27481.1 F-box/LRR-repeat protein 2 [Stylophora pistillata]